MFKQYLGGCGVSVDGSAAAWRCSAIDAERLSFDGRGWFAIYAELPSMLRLISSEPCIRIHMFCHAINDVALVAQATSCACL